MINSFETKIKELFGVDLRALAALRILVSLLVIFDLIFRAGDITAFYSDHGILPRNSYIEQFDSYYVSLYLINGTPFVQMILFFVTGFFAVLFFLGYCTQIVTIILWFLVASLHARNPLILTGGDTLLNLLLFWSIFLPLGARYSVDNILDPSGQKLPERILSFGTLAILAQVAFVYFFTALCKVSPEWLGGSAILRALNIDQYVLPFGLFLRQYPNLMKLLTHAVYGLEFVGPILLFLPFYTTFIRSILILAFFCLQAGFGLCLSVGIFPFSTSIAMLPFVPSWFWDRLDSSLSLIFAYLLDFFKKKNFLLRTPYCSLSLRTPWFTNFLPLLFLMTVLMWNLQSVDSLKFQMPMWLQRISYLLNIQQGWIMFGPKFLNEDFYYVYQGTLKSGKKIDLFKGGEEIDWKEPKNMSSVYKNHRWRTYVRNLWVSGNKLYPPYAQYLCHKWNKNHTGDNELTELEFYYIREKTLKKWFDKPVIGLMYKHGCY